MGGFPIPTGERSGQRGGGSATKAPSGSKILSVRVPAALSPILSDMASDLSRFSEGEIADLPQEEIASLIITAILHQWRNTGNRASIGISDMARATGYFG